jgi:hypothetical protein
VQPPEGLAKNKTWHQLSVPGCEPIYVADLRNPAQVRFVVLRPKLSRTGTPQVGSWEALFFRDTIGYVAHWYDSTINPRYAGTIN